MGEVEKVMRGIEHLRGALQRLSAPFDVAYADGGDASMCLLLPAQLGRLSDLDSRYAALCELWHEQQRAAREKELARLGLPNGEGVPLTALELAETPNAALGLWGEEEGGDDDNDGDLISDTSVELLDYDSDASSECDGDGEDDDDGEGDGSSSRVDSNASARRRGTGVSPRPLAGACPTASASEASATADETGLYDIDFSSPLTDSPPEQQQLGVPAPWRPPQLVLDYRRDGDGASASGKYDPGLVVQTVMAKPQGFDNKAAAIKLQGSVCANVSCGAPLKPKLSAVRMGRSFDHVRFCHYTGFYFCRRCHSRTRVEAIPARVLHNWDFVKLSVCDASADFLDLNFDAPIFHIDSINPKLYDAVPLLRAAMRVRVQLVLLHGIGVQCPKFCELFYGRPIGDMALQREGSGLVVKSSSALDGAREQALRRLAGYGAESTVVPMAKRYLVESHQFWSMADLVAIRDAQLAARAAGRTDPLGGASHCKLLRDLKTIRQQLARHVVQNCGLQCFSRGVQRCGICADSQRLVFTFDLNEVWCCPRCGAAYHRRCLLERPDMMPAGTCRVCEQQREGSRSRRD